LRVKLRGQPIELLTMLLQHPGEPVRRDRFGGRFFFRDFDIRRRPPLAAALRIRQPR